MSTSPVTCLRFLHNDLVATAYGSEAWALYELANAGLAGCTAITHPGPNWRADVHKWRKRGLKIESVHETHGEASGNPQVRYILHSVVEVLDLKEAA